MKTTLIGPVRYTGILAETRESLLSYKPSVLMAGWPAIFICLPCCGQVRAWMRVEDVPDHNVGPCPDGNWFVRYKDQPIPI